MVSLALSLVLCSAFAKDWTGYISDSKCGAKHSDGSEASIKCVQHCVKGGAAPVFVEAGKVIKIANGDKVTEELLGKKVTVSGKLEGDTLTIATIKAAK